MSTMILTQPTARISPRLTARMAGFAYLITFVAGSLALVLEDGKLVANLIATGAYVVVSVLFYVLFKPVNKNVSLTAAIISLAACTCGLLLILQIITSSISNLVF